MSEKTTTTWACDRCGATVELEPSKQPMDRRRLYVAGPPTWHADNKTVGDLCGDCWRSFGYWMNYGNATERER